MEKQVVCIGAALVDQLYFCPQPVVAHSSNPALCKRAVGGVATNVARHLAALHLPTTLVVAWGNDPEGQWLQAQLQHPQLQLNHRQLAPSTGQYSSILQPDGQLFTAVCVDEATALISPKVLESLLPTLQQAQLWMADANLSAASLDTLLQWSNTLHIPLIIEPVSVAKAQQVAQVKLQGLWLLTPNADELMAMAPSARTLDQAAQQLLDKGVQQVWVRQGAEGSSWYSKAETLRVAAQTCPITDSTGAGDAALAGWIYAYLEEQSVPHNIEWGHRLARHILAHEGAFDAQLGPEFFQS